MFIVLILYLIYISVKITKDKKYIKPDISSATLGPSHVKGMRAKETR